MVVPKQRAIHLLRCVLVHALVTAPSQGPATESFCCLLEQSQQPWQLGVQCTAMTLELMVFEQIFYAGVLEKDCCS